MRSRSITIFFLANGMFFAMVACQAPATPLITTQPPSELTLTALIRTLTAEPSAGMTDTPGPLQSMTETPSVPPTVTDTPSPAVTRVSVSAETNCRTGPSRYYKFVWKVDAGSTFEVVGKHEATNYWIIKLANGRECWLWGEYATVEGDVNSLPEYVPPAVGRIEGEVRHSSASDAKKIAQAFVNIGLGFDVFETGNDGKFFFEDVPIGEVKIKVAHDTYVFNNPLVYVSMGQLTFVIVTRIIPTSLTPIPTHHCPLSQPNCQSFPTFAPPVP